MTVLRTLLVLGALVAFAGTAAAVVLLEDPAGDATEYNGEYVGQRCGTFSYTAPYCPPLGHEAGVPAPADRDILSLDAEVGEDALRLTLTLPQLGDRAVAREGESGYLVYGVCLDAVCAYAFRSLDGPMVEGSYMSLQDASCPDFGTCYWAAPVTVEVGSPGRMSWDLPRGVLPDGWSPSAASAGVYRYDMSGTDMNVHANDLPAGGSAMWMGAYYTADAAEATLAPGVLALGAAPEVPLGLAAVESASSENSISLIGGTWEETADEIVLTARYADLPETAGTFLLGGTFAVRDGPSLIVIATPHADHWDSSASRCVERADHGGCIRTSAVPHEFSVVPGPDGSFTWRVPRVALGGLDAGDLLAEASWWAGPYDPGASVGATNVNRWNGQADYLVAPPMRLALDTAAAPATAGSAHLVADDVGDAQASAPGLPVDDAASLDVTFLELQALTSDLTRITLGIEKVASTIPPGYDALVYAVGLETPEGRFMVGFYRSSATQEFFCAQDTLVFADPPSDPLAVARQPVVGTVSAEGSSARQAGAAHENGASVTLFVPHACFAKVDGSPVNATRVAAGSFLVQNRGGLAFQASPADDVAFAEPLVLQAASAVASPSPWYANPFGIDSFYDIAGVVVAVLVFLLGLLAVHRKRSLLGRYLRDVEAAAALERPKAREAALRGVEARLKADLTRGRIAESHYVIVERRLDDALQVARSAAVRAAFSDLPFALVETLQRLLADGDMSPEDHRVFVTQLDGARGMTLEAKTEARERVRRWVQEAQEG